MLLCKLYGKRSIYRVNRSLHCYIIHASNSLDIGRLVRRRKVYINLIDVFPMSSQGTRMQVLLRCTRYIDNKMLN